MNKDFVIDQIKKHKLIVIARGLNKQELLDTAQAMYDGGVRLIEVTFNAKNNPTAQETADYIKALCEKFEGKMLIGAGTVLSVKQAKLAIDAGAKYIISPNVDKKVIRYTIKRGAVSIPGAFTPTESVTAHNYGADFVKIFPGGAVKSTYVKDLKAPLSHIEFLAVGGVNVDNIKEFLKNGASGVGIGSGIIDKDAVKSGDFAKVTALAKAFTSQIE